MRVERFLNNIKMLIIFLMTLITIGLSYTPAPKVYRYDPATGLWQRVNKDVSELIVMPNVQSGSSNISVSHEINGTIVVEPENTEKFSVKGQWYYYMEYVIRNSTEKSYYGIVAGQNQNIGITTVWNDDTYLYIKFELLYGWLASESHLKISYQEPSGNQSPGQFPYKTEHNPPTATYEYKVDYRNLKDIKCIQNKVFILLHLSVKKNNQQETAWAGGEPPSGMCVEVSNSKILWYIRKPGKYATNAFEVKVNSVYPVVVSFSNFDYLQPQGGIGLEGVEVYYAISDDLTENIDWISAPALNNRSMTLSSGSSSVNFYQLVDLKNQSSGIYRNTGTITFTIQNSKVYVDRK